MKQLTQVEELLRKRGARLTTQRRLVVKRAISRLHFTAEELVKEVRSRDDTVARGTVYRTLAMLLEADIVEKHDFRYGPPHYEVTTGREHHDHLLCIQCGEIIEFQEPRIERIQEDVVKRYGYKLMSHAHKLYGLCRSCQQKDPAKNTKKPKLHVEEVVS